VKSEDATQKCSEVLWLDLKEHDAETHSQFAQAVRDSRTQ
jgi:hypothetical protein